MIQPNAEMCMAVSNIAMAGNHCGSSGNINYCKMPDGTLIQWGRAYFPPAESIGLQTLDIELLIPFTTMTYAVTATWMDSAPETIERYVSEIQIDTRGIAVSNVRFATVRKIADANWWFRWIAIGFWK